MAQPRRRRGRGGGGGNGNGNGSSPQGGGGGRPRRTDLWRPVPHLPPAEAITPAADPTALLRSLGDPPLQGQGQVAEHYLAAVIERAAMLATALAASAGLLADQAGDDHQS